MTEIDNAEAAAAEHERLMALPRVNLHADWRGSAIIVLGYTGVVYSFQPRPVRDEPALALEGFMLPVEIEGASTPAKTPAEALLRVTYTHPDSKRPLHPRHDAQHPVLVANALPVTTKYGAGIFIWNFGEWVDGIPDYAVRVERPKH